MACYQQIEVIFKCIFMNIKILFLILISTLILGFIGYKIHLNKIVKKNNLLHQLTKIESEIEEIDDDSPITGKIFLINLENHPERLKASSDQLKRENIEYERFNAILGYDVDITAPNGIQYKGMDLKDGNLVFEKEKTYNIKCKNTSFKYHANNPKDILVAGTAGIYCSHYEIMNEIVKNNYPYAVIFEDDILLAKNFGKYLRTTLARLKEIPDFDILFLAVHMQGPQGEWYLGVSELPDEIIDKSVILPISPYNLKPKVKEDNFTKINDRFSKITLNSDSEHRIKRTASTYAYIISNAGAVKLLKYLKNNVNQVDHEQSNLIIESKINAYVVNESKVGVIWHSSYAGKGNEII